MRLFHLFELVAVPYGGAYCVNTAMECVLNMRIYKNAVTLIKFVNVWAMGDTTMGKYECRWWIVRLSSWWKSKYFVRNA